MEASEAARRIVWRHKWLLLICILIPAGIIAPYRLSRPATWSATASIQAQAAAPDASTQVLAIMSRVQAVATSPDVVQRAISAAGVKRNALQVSRHEVSITSLSTSAIVTLTVTDPSRAVALKLTDSLAATVVSDLNKISTQFNSQLTALARQQAGLGKTRRQLLRELNTAQSRGEQATSAVVQTLITELTATESELAANEASIQQIQSNSAASQGAELISDPAFAKSQSRHVAVYTALAGLFGLIVALLIGALRELVRPTIADPAAGARELSLVLLGNAKLNRRDAEASLDDDLPTKLDLAAHRVDARTLVLTGPLPAARLTLLADELNRRLPAIAEANGKRPRGNRISGVTSITTVPAPIEPDGAEPHVPGPALTITALPDITLGGRPKDPALVLVLPKFAPRPSLDQAVDVGVTTGWPMLGVIGVKKTRRPWFRRHDSEPELPSAEDSTEATAGSPVSDVDERLDHMDVAR